MPTNIHCDYLPLTLEEYSALCIEAGALIASKRPYDDEKHVY